MIPQCTLVNPNKFQNILEPSKNLYPSTPYLILESVFELERNTALIDGTVLP